MASMSRSGHETGLIWIQTACYVGGHEGRQALKPLHASTKRRLQKHRAASSRRRSASDHPDSTRIVFNMDLSKARWPRRQRSLAPFPQIDCGGCSTSSGNLNPYMCDPRKNIAAQEPRRGRETMGFMTAAPASPHHASSFVPYMQQTRGVLCCEATVASASHGPFLGSVEQTRNTEWRASQAAYPEREMCQCVTSQSLRCRPGRRCGSLSLQ